MTNLRHDFAGDEHQRYNGDIVIARNGPRTSQSDMEVLERCAKAFLPNHYSEVDHLQTLSQVLVR